MKTLHLTSMGMRTSAGISENARRHATDKCLYLKLLANFYQLKK